MAKYRSKTFVVDAAEARQTEQIQTTEGTLTAQPGDWIVTGVRGERYPVKPDSFEAMFEPAEEGRREQRDRERDEQEQPTPRDEETKDESEKDESQRSA